MTAETPLLQRNCAFCKTASCGMDGASTMAKLSNEIDAAVREIGCVKAALMGRDGDNAESKGFLGLTCAKDRAPLLQLLQLSMQQLDRLREKEIELIRSATATATTAATAVRQAKQPYSPGEKERWDLFRMTHSLSRTGGAILMRRFRDVARIHARGGGARLSCTQRACLPPPLSVPSRCAGMHTVVVVPVVLLRFSSTVAVRFLILYEYPLVLYTYFAPSTTFLGRCLYQQVSANNHFAKRLKSHENTTT